MNVVALLIVIAVCLLVFFSSKAALFPDGE